MEGNDVHGAHGQACPVHKAPDVSVQTDVGQPELTGSDFRRIFFGWIKHGRDRLLAEECIVIKVELGIDGKHLAIRVVFAGRGNNQRVNFSQAAISLTEALHQP